jgi:hypothetical protein
MQSVKAGRMNFDLVPVFAHRAGSKNTDSTALVRDTISVI